MLNSCALPGCIQLGLRAMNAVPLYGVIFGVCFVSSTVMVNIRAVELTR